MKHRVLFHAVLVITVAVWLVSICIAEEVKTGNVIFIHPDGAGLNSWNACRIIKVGPDGEIAWDRLLHIGIYRGHMKDGLTATSHGGATTHAYGVKVPADSYGMHGKKTLKALSGFSGSIMQEAQKVGKAVGIVNSGNIGEPGTGVFLASAPSRLEIEKIAEQVMTSGAQVILSGGEKYLLPDRKQGFHGKGVRKDGRDLIEDAKTEGYTVVYTRKQLEKLDLEKVEKLLGIFAANDTYNDLTEELLDAANLPLYALEAPTFSQMVSAALRVLSKHPEGFLLIAEEEGSDNFGNANNAYGVLEALQRADASYDVVLKFIERNANTLLVTTSDSDAGGLQVVCPALSSGEQFRQDK
ncbi:MAG TPA: alkaline phosphatase, partial [Desulfobacterales bacterium]|nr:alkaline phosphatase [Desulfobacterales bacterium]